jgi:hypothetical protein
MIPNTPTVTLPIAPIIVQGVGDAIRVIRNAQVFCLRASYHPFGGETCNQVITTPITHTVWVMGKQSDIDEFLKSGAA